MELLHTRVEVTEADSHAGDADHRQAGPIAFALDQPSLLHIDFQRIGEYVDGVEPDLVIECTGATSVILDVVERVASDGLVCLAGLSSGGHELKFENQQLVANYLRMGYDPNGSWRIYKLRPDFNPADKVHVLLSQMNLVMLWYVAVVALALAKLSGAAKAAGSKK